MLGMCSYLYRDYIIESNRETGEGRADIYLKSKTGGQDIIMEFKHAENKQVDLKELAQIALDQIKERGYAMRGNTLLLGMAHSGKNCEIIYEQIGK